MQDRHLRTAAGTFEEGHYTGNEDPGIVPIGDLVVIKIDVAAERLPSGIYVDQQSVERNTMAATTGILVSVGDGAFEWNGDRTRPWTGLKPVIGDRVFMERYSGHLHPGRDGSLYRVMTDKCIAGILSDPPAVAPAAIVPVTSSLILPS